MINKPLNDIAAEDIRRLVEDEVPEGTTLEYKECLPGKKDRREFLADVSSFANAAGGDLIYGVREKRDSDGKPTGEPGCACGVAVANPGNEVLRLENRIHDSVHPRIPGLCVRYIEGFDIGPVIIVRIPRSWAAPHMTAEVSSQFYTRHSAGKYPLDVGEIRSAFLQSETITESIRKFRDERLGRIVADETPASLGPGYRLVLHIVPVSNRLARRHVNLEYQDGPMRGCLLTSQSALHRYNLDGMLLYQRERGARDVQYAQFYRDGTLESVVARVTQVAGQPSIYPEHTAYPVLRAVKSFQLLHERWGTEPPFIIMTSLLGVKGHTLTARGHMIYRDFLPIDRDTVILPEVMYDPHSSDPEHSLHTMFDAMWQAAGWEGSLDYDDDGNWIGPT